MSQTKEIKVGIKGQIVIPKEFREDMKIKSGEMILIKKVGERLILIPKPRDPIRFIVEVGKRTKLGDLRKEIKKHRLIE
jgi:AbrB family looped-hinge helix DNA binding protein